MSEIVVGVDESQGAAAAIRWAAREGDLHGWSVTAVMAWGLLDQHHVVDDKRFDPSYGEADALDALTQILDAAVGGSRAADIDRRVACDLPARALLEASAHSRLLVVGARGLGGFRGLLLGSVSQHCLHHATTSIAIVRDSPDQVAAGVNRSERIVVAVDGSEPAREALRWAVDEGRAHGAAVHAIHACGIRPTSHGIPTRPQRPNPRDFQDLSRDVLERAVAAVNTDRLSMPIEQTSAPGPASSAILDAAKGADLVVMGSARPAGGFKGMLLGSVTAQVTHHASCPVVVIRHRTNAALEP